MNRTQLSQLAVLAAVSEHRSFRAAAKELLVAPSAISHVALRYHFNGKDRPRQCRSCNPGRGELRRHGDRQP